jgi:DUF1365 family protein
VRDYLIPMGAATDGDGPILAATFCGRRRDLTTAKLLAALLRLPVVTLKVIGGIHFRGYALVAQGSAAP